MKIKFLKLLATVENSNEKDQGDKRSILQLVAHRRFRFSWKKKKRRRKFNYSSFFSVFFFLNETKENSNSLNSLSKRTYKKKKHTSRCKTCRTKNALVRKFWKQLDDTYYRSKMARSENNGTTRFVNLSSLLILHDF